MPMVNIYVFKEPRNWKNVPGEQFPFMYADPAELETRLLQEIHRDQATYKVTAFSTYGALVSEVYRSEKTRGKVV